MALSIVGLRFQEGSQFLDRAIDVTCVKQRVTEMLMEQRHLRRSRNRLTQSKNRFFVLAAPRQRKAEFYQCRFVLWEKTQCLASFRNGLCIAVLASQSRGERTVRFGVVGPELDGAPGFGFSSGIVLDQEQVDGVREVQRCGIRGEPQCLLVSSAG